MDSSAVRRDPTDGDSAVPGGHRRAVAIGGGHGLARTLRALPQVADHVTAIVTAADDGGSSGRLRRDFDVLPPGDLRMALSALARDDALAEIVQYRFTRGELAGHSLGNLMLVALVERSKGDVVRALDRLASLLEAPGRVLPCTTMPVTLHAKTAAGEVTGQVAVAATPRLQRVWLDPQDPPATPEAVAAIERADLVVIGPGSLYTSLLPNLLVPGIGAALTGTTARTVFVANLREQPGETEGMTLDEHLDALELHLPDVRIDAVIYHDGPPPSGEGTPLTAPSSARAARLDQLVALDMLDGHDGHDPSALARALDAVLSS